MTTEQTTRQEQDAENALPRSAPEAQGIPPAAVRAFLNDAERKDLGLHSLMVLRHGHVVAEGWWDPYGPTHPHMLFSLSKSFCSTAAGLAIAEGKLSLDDTVLSFFPDEAPADLGPNLTAMRLRHLLSMSTGHDQDTTGRLRDGAGGDWVRAFLAQPVEHAPGTHFVYNSGATYMVSAIVQKVTGQTVLDYLGPRLFGPLGITGQTWESSPQGISVGGWGLNITTEDIARFGQLYLQKGVWRGERLLPEAWVAEATSAQVSNGDDPNSDWAQGYGFQFWRCRHDAYRGDGAFGQFCVVLPEQEAVVAMTAGSGNLGGVLNLVWEHLLPALGSFPLPPDAPAQEQLRAKLAGLSLPAPDGARTSPLAATVSGKTYAFAAGDANEHKTETACWNFDGEGATVTIQDALGGHRIEAGAETWRRGTTTLREGRSHLVAARGAWTAEDTYVLTAYFYETPFALTLIARFTDGGVQFDLRQNVSFGPTERPPLEGRPV
jgi:CubicO group peptidase (beta-lactamase class C family)